MCCILGEIWVFSLPPSDYVYNVEIIGPCIIYYSTQIGGQIYKVWHLHYGKVKEDNEQKIKGIKRNHLRAQQIADVSKWFIVHMKLTTQNYVFLIKASKKKIWN